MPLSSPDRQFATAEDQRRCRAAIRTGSRTFYAASKLLPASVRRPAYGLYAFCRLSDDAIDLDGGSMQALSRLYYRLDRAHRGRPLPLPADRAMADLLREHAIPVAIPEALLEGLGWDAEGRRYETIEDLHGYAAFVTLAMNEPFGVMGIVCPDEAPLLALVSLVAPAIAMGNAVVAVPSAAHPLAATDFYSVLDTSDVPAGVVNIVTGDADALALTLAEHDGVDALWRAGAKAGEKRLEEASAGNLKPTWMLGEGVDWGRAEGREHLRRACQIKTIWTPYGE